VHRHSHARHTLHHHPAPLSRPRLLSARSPESLTLRLFLAQDRHRDTDYRRASGCSRNLPSAFRPPAPPDPRDIRPSHSRHIHSAVGSSAPPNKGRRRHGPPGWHKQTKVHSHPLASFRHPSSVKPSCLQPLYPPLRLSHVASWFSQPPLGAPHHQDHADTQRSAQPLCKRTLLPPRTIQAPRHHKP